MSVLSLRLYLLFFFFFFFNDTATTEIYTLSLHDALPISRPLRQAGRAGKARRRRRLAGGGFRAHPAGHRHILRSEEHTSELQSQSNLVCRLLLEKKKYINKDIARAYHNVCLSYKRYMILR